MSVRILVVDDEPDLENLVRQKFRKEIRASQFEFLFAENGVDAIDTLKREGDVDLILTDINMPEMDGLTLLSKLHEFDHSAFKSVIVSAYGDMENIRTAMNRGAFDFVTKPIDLQDLETTIHKSLNELQLLKQGVESTHKLLAIEQELRVATDIQMSILPQTFPPFPDKREIEVYAKMLPAKEVGGDLYDFFAIDKDRIGFVIGDVSGKGVPAAMLMAVCRTLLRATALRGIAPDACLDAVNRVLVDESLSSMFVTVFYGVLNTRNGRLEYCSGGHNPPYLLFGDGRVDQLDNAGGLAVGAMEDSEYQSNMITLQPGDAVFLYTDGVTEAVNANEDLFEEHGLEDSLQRFRDRPVKELVEKVIEVVQEFSRGVPQADDITCLAIRYAGRAG
ncbi:MAG: SpoIIE family protein phosphatase [Candidatus Krumholzibacteria bacterium]|nr:SpoIIE family protein phosphatase [Candidatus Krumholzibacteria bacterium]